MESSDSKYKHKPSEKHTLEEVLKSLQDLIRVDLSEGRTAAGKPGPPQMASRPRETAEPKPNLGKSSSQREDFAPVSPGAAPVNLDAVMRSLKELITNELDVGDDSKPAAAHDEYLAKEEDIEEYIPDELSLLDEELETRDEPIPEELEAAPPPDDVLAPEVIDESTLPKEITPLDEELAIEEPVELAPPPSALTETTDLPGEKSTELDESPAQPVPEEFIPLDEELTFEAPVEPEIPSTVLEESMELPGEISPDLLAEPVSPPPAGDASLLEPAPELAPGTQHELFFEEAHSRAPGPGSVATNTAPRPSPESEPAPKPPASWEEHEQLVEAKHEEAAEALPTIDVEESFDDRNYFANTTSGEITPPASEETIDLSVKISSEPQTDMSPAAEMTAAPEPKEPPVAPADEATGKKITLEIVDEPIPEKTHDKYSVDFDSSDLSPPLPEEPELTPLEAGPTAESVTPAAPPDDLDSSDLSPPLPEEPELTPLEADPTAESVTPAATTEADSTPAPEPETTAPAQEAPAIEAKTETPPITEHSREAGETSTPQEPVSIKLDDIPVLKDVVASPGDGRRKKKTATPAPKPPLPAPDRAREIVVRAVAKLNVEMRKSGSAGLDTRTILRLQQLIRQELEKGGEK
ncbi:MAG: hypothetical protein NUV51_02720 [Sulfuricaulis sp.]|nr:hypothetical protein [Sulfuricaulis sp.]